MDFRLRVIREVLEHDTSVRRAAELFGVGPQTVTTWLRRHRERGLDGLVPQVAGRKRRNRALAGDPRRDAVVEAKHQHPDCGNVRAWLDRLSKRKSAEFLFPPR